MSGSEDRDAQVVVVGAGPAGSSAAAHLAAAGVDVLLLEKGSFPRDKVCGDGLTPRAVRELGLLGVEVDGPAAAGWARTKGLRLVAGGRSHDFPWPSGGAFPDHGLVRTRADFDELLARHAAARGARLAERRAVVGPLRDEATGRVTGVVSRAVDDAGRRSGDDEVHRAAVVLAADGVSSRTATALGVHRRTDRPLGVAARAYYRTPRASSEWMESWLELWSGQPRRSPLLPGYGWIFGLGDGTANVGLGVVDPGSRPGGRPRGRTGREQVDVRDALRRWLATTPADWQLDEDHRVSDVRSAALPMGFNRTPHAVAGALLLGDAGGMVNPFNGEGIEYAMHSGRLAADAVVRSLRAGSAAGRELALAGYAEQLRAELGGYFTLGRAFTRLIDHPPVMAAAVRAGLPNRRLMRVVVRLMANLAAPPGARRRPSSAPGGVDVDAADRIVNLLTRLAPRG